MKLRLDDFILNDDIEVSEETLINNSSNKVILACKELFNAVDENNKQFRVVFKGKGTNSAGYLLINDLFPVPLNSETLMDINVPSIIKISLVVAAESSISIDLIDLFAVNDNDFVAEVETKNDVLVIVPDYPSYVNLYTCAFAHSRNRNYVKNGLNVQVFAVNSSLWYQTKYNFDGVDVIKSNYKDLKKLLNMHLYKTIVVHFVDEKLLQIFDGCVYNNERLLFICHGPETVYRYLVNKTRPYFTLPYKEPIQNDLFDLKDRYVKKYANKQNVYWSFVSEWLKNFSEEQLGLKFKNSCVINNIMDGDLFPYVPKNKEDRKKILVIRKFDNICQHSIDQVVMCILELSRRSIFQNLEFDIYGDGNFYDELVEPLKKFDNVNLIRRFIPNKDLNKVYANHGIILLPSRHDAHAVSMGEAALSGLVVLGSNVTSNPYFMNEVENHTLTDPEDFVGLADIIEKLYNDPDEFLRISKNMHEFTSQFNVNNTVMKEIDLIKLGINDYDKLLKFVPIKKEKPILTIGVPAYNVEKYIEKTLLSILNCKKASKIEILVVNDGSKDNTADIVKKYEKLSNGIVRLINKENGGHGSTINRAIKEAKGKYFRLVDGDDWVDSENLDKLIDIMLNSDTDIILTTGSYDYVEEADFANIISYDNLVEGKIYNFDDLVYDKYGFASYGPLLTTGNYKLSVLKQANFSITEKKPYVDMEFNSFSIKYVKTLQYYNLNIYRYLIGREGQTISRDVWKKKYKDHQYIIFNILNKVINDKDYSANKLLYIYKNIISQMVDSQIFMFDSICKWDELDEFLEKLKSYDDAYDYAMDFIDKRNGNCKLILNAYKKIKSNRKEPIIKAGYIETMNDYGKLFEHNINLLSFIKKCVKVFIPYGLIQLYRRRRFFR